MKLLLNLDANGSDSSGSSDAMSADSSTANTDGQQGAKESGSLVDYLKKEGLMPKADDPDLANQDDQGSEIQKMNETAEGKDKVDPEKKKVDKTEVVQEEETEQQDKVESEEEKQARLKEEERWDKHPRSQQVITERNEAREQIKALEPKAQWRDEVWGFMQQYNVTPDQYKAAIEFTALCNIDPEAALKQIEPVYQKLKGFTGDTLPDDLQRKVDMGTMELADAREFAALRAKLEFGNKKSEFDQRTTQQREQDRANSEMANSIRSWDESKRKNDPDFRPKQKPTDEDGKWEEVRDKYVALINRTEIDQQGRLFYPNLPRNGSEATALFEKAYQIVSKKTTMFKAPTRKNLSSNGSSTANGSRNTDPAKAKTMVEAMQIGYEQSQKR